MRADDTWQGDAQFLDLVASTVPGIDTVQAQIFVRAAGTGARPILLRCSDQKSYWCKWPGNPHGNLSLFHELVVAGIGLELGAPVRPIKLVEIDESFIDDVRIDGTRLPSGRYIGSELLALSDEATAVDRVKRDGNPERYAYLYALYDLCMGDDLQLLHAVAAEDEVWSIDHGLWFWSVEGDWTQQWLAANTQTSGAWESRPAGLDPTALLDAASRVELLTPEALARTWASLPEEWEIEAEQQAALAKFVIERRSGVSARLQALSSHYSQRKR